MAVPTPTPTYYFSRTNQPTGVPTTLRNTTAMQQLANDIVAHIPGWVIWDNQLAVASPYIVLQANTSEQAAAFYVKFDMEANQPYGPEVSVWEAWNAGTHSGTNTTAVGFQRWQWGTNYTVPSPTQINYWGCGSTDHLYIFAGPVNGQTMLPLYVGLVDKIRPDLDTAVNGVIIASSVYEYSGTETVGYTINVAPCVSYTNRTPYLRSKAGILAEVAHIYNTTPFSLGYQVNIVRENGSLYSTAYSWAGPWLYNQAGYAVYPRTQWYRMMLVESYSAWGPRGHLKSVLMHNGAGYDQPFPHLAKIRIASRDYLSLAITTKDGTVAQSNGWGTQTNTFGQHPVFLMPTSDWYTNAYITA